MKENDITNLNLDDIKKQTFLEMQRREIITGYLSCALWEYNIAERCQYQYKKLDGKWMEDKDPIRNFRETVISWGLIHPDDLQIFNAYCDSLDNGESDFSYEMRMMGDNEKFIWIRYTGKSVCDENGKPVSVIGVTYDVSDKYNHVRDLDRCSDEVTGLLDYRCLDLMKVQIGELDDYENAALILIDIDDFNSLNAKYGKVFCDYLLEQIGKMICSHFPKNSVIGRLGGDQFAVYFSGFSDVDSLESQLRTLQNAIKCNRFNHNVETTVSVGACAVIGAEYDFHDILQNAETALYIVKRRDKNSCHIYNSSDKSAMPPDCRQLKFSERFDNRSPLYLSQLKDHEKRLFDYAFQQLNSTADFYSAVTDIFSEFGKQYEIDVVTLAHKYNDMVVSVPVVWKSDGSAMENDSFEKHINRHWEKLSTIITYNNQTLVCDDIRLLSDDAFFNDAEYKMDTKSLMICGIFDNEALAGFIAFDNVSSYHIWTEGEISVFSSIARMISSYMIRYLSKKNLQNEILYSNAILENKDMLGYTIDPDTYKITYATNHVTNFFKNLKIGDVCYKAVMGRNSPCSNCPAAMLKDGVKKYTEELYNRYCNAWFSATASRLNLGKGREEYLLCLTDVTQFMDRVQSHDRLTGLLTFDKFELECTKNFDSFSEDYFVVVAKVMRFGEITDDYGFETGNRVLKEIASKFNRSITRQETVCRSNGASFFALLKADVYWKVENRLNALFRSIEDSVRLIEPDFKLCMVAGIYQITTEDKQFNSCLDKANYALKKITNGRFVTQSEIRTYDKEMDEEVSVRNEIERNMYSALNNGEFQVYYQPKVELGSERIYGAEALVRWIKPDGKIISPGVFVPVFEENEFILDMDFYVYEVVLRDMRRLMDEGISLPVISLNVSRQHFLGGEFPEKFCRLVNKYEIPHEKIELELTETTLFNNVDHLISVLNLLRQRRGFRISVDDFGSGYSSLNLISVLPVDALKIDGKFFMANEMSTKNKKVIETILQLASTLNFDTVSEGVETKEQVEFLKQTNCNAVQGYFYYRPMKFNDFKNLIMNQS